MRQILIGKITTIKKKPVKLKRKTDSDEHFHVLVSV